MIFDIRKTYPDFGRCIYCPPNADVPEHLGEEHIIPKSFGGEKILFKASCQKHEKITSKFENDCFKGMIDTARYHIGLSGRHKLKQRDNLPVIIAKTGKSEKIPIKDHPSALIMPLMPPPLIHIMSNEENETTLSARIIVSPVGSDIIEKARKIKKDISLTRGFEVTSFYRLIAKIAHSFAIAELGQVFDPCLLNLIDGVNIKYSSRFVGSGLDDRAIPSDLLHEIDFAEPVYDQDGKEFIQIRVRLFANLGMPNHYAVVGARKKQS